MYIHTKLGSPGNWGQGAHWMNSLAPCVHEFSIYEGCKIYANTKDKPMFLLK